MALCYEKLSRRVMTPLDLERHGYPIKDPSKPGFRKVPPQWSRKVTNDFERVYPCRRCKKNYEVGGDGIQLASAGECCYHNRPVGNHTRKYLCCEGAPGTRGCGLNPYHIHEGETLMANYSGFVETLDKPELEPDRHGVFALDCEMCCTNYGLELTQVTIVDHNCQVVYDELVKPSNPILDYNTQFSGITKSQLDAASKRLEDVQRDLLEMFSSKTILVGHSLEHDMAALKLIHRRFVDTTHLYPHKFGLPQKRALKQLVEDELGTVIRKGGSHDSKTDAIAALRLALKKCC